MRKSTVFFDDELRRRIERAARKDGVSEAEVIHAAVYEYTDSLVDEPLGPESFGIAESGRIPAAQLDEWPAKNRERDWECSTRQRTR